MHLIEKCDDVWSKYLSDIIATNHGITSIPCRKILEQHISAERSIASVHVCIRLKCLKSKQISLLRIYDDILEKFPQVEDTVADISLLHENTKLFKILIETIYSVLVHLDFFTSSSLINAVTCAYLQMVC